MCSLYGHDSISDIVEGSNSILGGMNVTYNVIAAICTALISLESKILGGPPISTPMNGVDDVHLRRDAHAHDNHIR